MRIRTDSGLAAASISLQARTTPLWALLLVALVWACTSVPLAAQTDSSLSQPKPSDVRIVIDISGSMKKNDPENLRRPALDMLVKLLPEGSRAGVWTFGQYVNMLVKHRPVDAAWKQEALSKGSAINSVAQYTNIGEALEKAAYDKQYSTRANFQTHVILLTDGMVDINRDPTVNQQERQRILDSVVPNYQQADYTLHTISLSDNADSRLMERLALATDGNSAVAKTADELMNVFLEVFDQAVPKEELPLEGNTFATDSSIEEFTALIFRRQGTPETRLISPDQTEYNKNKTDATVNWYRTEQYDLVTVKQPLEGEWRILAELEPQSRITVVSDLSLVVKPLPANLQINEAVELSLGLREENKIVSRAEFLQLLDIDVQVKSDNGQQWDQRLSDGLVPGNGIYQTQMDYFQDVGQYDIVVKVDGKTFKRQFTHRAKVRTPFAVESEVQEQNGTTQFVVTVTPQLKTVDFASTKVVGKLKTPAGTSTIKPFELTDQQVWQLPITPEQEGKYHLTLRITSTDENGTLRDIVPEPLQFTYPVTNDPFASLLEQPTPVEQPEPAPAQPKPAAADRETKAKEEPEVTEEPLEEEEDEGNTLKWILYGVLGVVNLLIVFVVYLLYRKLFGKKADDTDAEDDAPAVAETGEAKAAAAEPEMAGFDEPPMDEMMVDELDDEIDLAEDTSTEADMELSMPELDTDPAPQADSELDSETEPLEDALAEITPEALDDIPTLDTSDDDDEDPEFSLDDFAPDALDDDEDKPKQSSA